MEHEIETANVLQTNSSLQLNKQSAFWKYTTAVFAGFTALSIYENVLLIDKNNTTVRDNIRLGTLAIELMSENESIQSKYVQTLEDLKELIDEKHIPFEDTNVFTREILADIATYNSGSLDTKETVLQKWNAAEFLPAEAVFIAPITYKYLFRGSYNYHNNVTVKIDGKIEGSIEKDQYKIELNPEGVPVNLDPPTITDNYRAEYVATPKDHSIVTIYGDKNPIKFRAIFQGLEQFTTEHPEVELSNSLPKLEEKLIEKGYLLKQ